MAARLAERGAAYTELRRQVIESVRARCAEDTAMRERLADRARGLLGPRAHVRPDPAGGLRATARGRTVDLSAPALANRALEAYGARAEGLWLP